MSIKTDALMHWIQNIFHYVR